MSKNYQIWKLVHKSRASFEVYDCASFSTVFKHWSENSTNRGSCMAAFIASYLLSALSMERSNCLRWGLQRRSLSSFDWPVGNKKRWIIHIGHCWKLNLCGHTLDVIILRKTEGLRAGTKGNVGLLPNSWSLCRGTLSVMSSSSKRSSTVHGSAKTVKQKDIHTGNMNIVKVGLCWLASAVTSSTKGNIKRQFLTS